MGVFRHWAKAKSAGLGRDLATVKFLVTLGPDDRVPPGGPQQVADDLSSL